MTTNFIEANHVLLVAAKWPDGDTEWTGVDNEIYATAKDALGVVTDNCTRAIRLVPAGLTESDDVTEELAEAWLDYCGLSPDEVEAKAPPLVTESAAFRLYADAWRETQAEDEKYGSYRDQVEREYRRAAGY